MDLSAYLDLLFFCSRTPLLTLSLGLILASAFITLAIFSLHHSPPHLASHRHQHTNTLRHIFTEKISVFGYRYTWCRNPPHPVRVILQPVQI